MASLPKKVLLKDGRIAAIDLLSRKDSAKELLSFINAFIDENAFMFFEEPCTLKAEKEFISKSIKNYKEKKGYLLVARVDGKIAGTSSAERKELKARNNVELGIAISKEFRGLGLGEALLMKNVSLAKQFLKPKNLVLTVFSENKPARALYKKLGFKEFAEFPNWILHKGRYMDLIHMRL